MTKMHFIVFIGLIAIVGIQPLTLEALEPPTAEQLEEYRRDGSLPSRIEAAKAIGNHRVHPELARRAHQKAGLLARAANGDAEAASELAAMTGSAPPEGWAGMPTHGTVNVVAFLIDFPDYPHIAIDTPERIGNILFGDGYGGFPTESLRKFYQRSSYDKLHIQGNVLGWYTTSYPRTQVPQTSTGLRNLMKEVVTYHDAQGHDFSQYDNDQDGVVDYMIFIWAGPHGQWASFWWGYMSEFYDSSYLVDGVRLGTYSWQWEAYSYPYGRFDAGVVIHETGHALGLPDYYDYDGNYGPDGGVGGLDQMDGTWGDHNSFSKFLLDWLVPQTIVEGTHRVTLNGSSTTTDTLLVMPDVTPGDQFDEYYMVQNRYRDQAGNDTTYPTNGLLVWHVDATLNNAGTSFRYDNSYTSRKLLRLMEADGLEEIETGNGQADAGDYYTIGSLFGPSTAPNSNRYDGTSTNINLSDISTSGPVMNFLISFQKPRQPVWRFYNPALNTHFYTINDVEQQALMSESGSSGYVYEGVAWYAFPQPEPQTVPVYRFFSPLNQSHFFTISEVERDYVLSQYSEDIWKYEGIGWYDYAENNAAGNLPVHRFWSPAGQSHFFTIDTTERDYLINHYEDAVWHYEGIVWYSAATP